MDSENIAKLVEEDFHPDIKIWEKSEEDLNLYGKDYKAYLEKWGEKYKKFRTNSLFGKGDFKKTERMELFAKNAFLAAGNIKAAYEVSSLGLSITLDEEELKVISEEHVFEYGKERERYEKEFDKRHIFEFIKETESYDLLFKSELKLSRIELFINELVRVGDPNIEILSYLLKGTYYNSCGNEGYSEEKLKFHLKEKVQDIFKTEDADTIEAIVNGWISSYLDIDFPNIDSLKYLEGDKKKIDDFFRKSPHIKNQAIKDISERDQHYTKSLDFFNKFLDIADNLPLDRKKGGPMLEYVSNVLYKQMGMLYHFKELEKLKALSSHWLKKVDNENDLHYRIPELIVYAIPYTILSLKELGHVDEALELTDQYSNNLRNISQLIYGNETDFVELFLELAEIKSKQLGMKGASNKELKQIITLCDIVLKKSASLGEEIDLIEKSFTDEDMKSLINLYNEVLKTNRFAIKGLKELPPSVDLDNMLAKVRNGTISYSDLKPFNTLNDILGDGRYTGSDDILYQYYNKSGSLKLNNIFVSFPYEKESRNKKELLNFLKTSKKKALNKKIAYLELIANTSKPLEVIEEDPIEMLLFDCWNGKLEINVEEDKFLKKRTVAYEELEKAVEHQKNGDYELALQNYEKVIERDPNCVFALGEIAKINIRGRTIEEIDNRKRDLLIEAIRRFPESFTLWYGFGRKRTTAQGIFLDYFFEKDYLIQKDLPDSFENKYTYKNTSDEDLEEMIMIEEIPVKIKNVIFEIYKNKMES